MESKYVFAAVKNTEELSLAIKSKAVIIFHLMPNIFSLPDEVKKVHECNKKIFIHIDLAEGIGKDKYGLHFAKKIGVDGIISTRSSIIKMAKELGFVCVQRFFAVDSHSVDTTIESIKLSKTDMIEIMPGVIPKIISKIKTNVNLPIIAGGLIDKKEEVLLAYKAGATAISTGNQMLWDF